MDAKASTELYKGGNYYIPKTAQTHSVTQSRNDAQRDGVKVADLPLPFSSIILFRNLQQPIVDDLERFHADVERIMIVERDRCSFYGLQAMTSRRKTE